MSIAAKIEPPPNRQLVVEHLHIQQLQFNPKNPKRHPRSKIFKLAASIKALGMNAPMLVDGELMILSGEARVKACRELGLTMIPVIRLEHLTANEAELFMIPENRFGELSEMAPKALARLFKDLSVLNLDISRFEMGEIDLMIEDLDLSVGEEEPPPELAAGPAVSRIGDRNPCSGLEHMVCCADALAAASYELLMGREVAAAVITDPPFGNPIAGYLTGQGRARHREFVQGSEGRSPEELEAFLASACRQSRPAPGQAPWSTCLWTGAGSRCCCGWGAPASAN